MSAASSISGQFLLRRTLTSTTARSFSNITARTTSLSSIRRSIVSPSSSSSLLNGARSATPIHRPFTSLTPSKKSGASRLPIESAASLAERENRPMWKNFALAFGIGTIVYFTYDIGRDLSRRYQTRAALNAATSHKAKFPPPSIPVTETKLKVGLIQLAVGADKKANLDEAEKRIEEAVKQGAKLVVLPEMFNSPYGNAFFNEYSESVLDIGAKHEELTKEQSVATSPSSVRMSTLAKKHNVYLIAGSIAERAAINAAEGEKKHAKSGLDYNLYNTSVVFSPQGDIIAKHRKMHLFDIDVPGKMTFIESDTLSPGSRISFFDTEYGRIGLGICYDMRFGEYAQILAENECKMIVYPAAFNTTTGPMHWELLQRARAVDNQLWVATCSPARSTDGKGYQAWGHSSLISPWGVVKATTEHTPAVIVSEVDMAEVEDMRKSIPVRVQKRADIYKLKF